MAVQITSQTELEEWLQDKPVELAQSIASRVALRVLPLVLDVQGNQSSGKAFERSQGLTLQVFRANFISWAACKYPAHDMKGSAASASASASASAYADEAAAVYASASASAAVYASAAVSADAAYADEAAAVYASASASAAVNAAAVYASADAAYADEAAAYADEAAAAAAMWRSVESDWQWLEAHHDSSGLISQPLWQEGETAGFPDWVKQPLDRFAALPERGRKPEWRLILDWYRALVPMGRSTQPHSAFGEKADVEIALKPKEFWTVTEDRSTEQILWEIGEIADRKSPSVGSHQGEGDQGNTGDLAELEADIQTAIDNIEPQAPAAYRFAWRDGKIVAVPQADAASDPRGAQTMLDEARHKAELLKELLDRSNAEQRVKTSVDGLLDALPEQISDLDEYRLRSRFRSIEADARAYLNNEAELVPDAVASLVDLSETLKDLQSFYPALRNMEAEVEAIEIPIAQIDDALDLDDSVVRAADGVSEAVDSPVSDDGQEMEIAAKQEATFDERDQRANERQKEEMSSLDQELVDTKIRAANLELRSDFNRLETKFEYQAATLTEVRNLIYGVIGTVIVSAIAIVAIFVSLQFGMYAVEEEGFGRGISARDQISREFNPIKNDISEIRASIESINERSSENAELISSTRNILEELTDEQRKALREQ